MLNRDKLLSGHPESEPAFLNPFMHGNSYREILWMFFVSGAFRLQNNHFFAAFNRVIISHMAWTELKLSGRISPADSRIP